MTEEIEQQLKDAEKMLKEAETKLEDIENILCANLAKNTENALNVLQERLSFRWGLVTTHLEKLQKLEKNSVRVRILTAESSKNRDENESENENENESLLSRKPEQSNEDKTSITHMQVEESSASNESSDEESESEGKTAISKPIKTQSSESSDEESEDEEKDTSKEIHINGQNKKGKSIGDESDNNSDSESESDSDSDNESNSESDSENESGGERESDSESESENDSDSGSGSDSESDSESSNENDNDSDDKTLKDSTRDGIKNELKVDNTDNDVIDTFSSPHTPTVKENGSVYTTPTKRNMDNCATPSTIGKSDYENDTWRNQKKVRLEDQISEYGQRAYRDLYTKRGKDFRTQKTKKKRGIYRGGKIDLQPRSIKF